MKRGLLIAAIASHGAACTESRTPFAFPPTDVVYEGELLRIHASPGLEPCGGSGPAMERMLRFFQSETKLGELEAPIEVYWLEHEQVQEICSLGTAVVGCSLSTSESVTTRMPEEHELVHSYFERKGEPFRYSFFDEGLATVYGAESRAPASMTLLDEAMSFSRRMPGRHYARAGNFVAFLLEEFGPERTADFVAFSSDITPESLPADFGCHFGESLESVIAAYSAFPQTCSGAGWQRQAACEMDPSPWDHWPAWTVNVGAGCDSDSALGSLGGSVAERFVLDAPRAGRFSVSAEGSVDEHRPEVEILRCGGCEDEFSYTLDLDVSDRLVNLPLEAGRYLVTSTFDTEAEVEPSRVTISPE